VRVPRASAALGGPGAPTAVRGVARDHGALVSWRPPRSDGGSPVTGYVIKAWPGGKSVRTSVVTSFLVGGLANGRAYTFAVAAVNKDARGPESRPSAAVIPRAPTVPWAPRSAAAVAGFRQATVSWAAPRSDGGAPVSSYRISTRLAGAWLCRIVLSSASAGAQVACSRVALGACAGSMLRRCHCLDRVRPVRHASCYVG